MRRFAEPAGDTPFEFRAFGSSEEAIAGFDRFLAFGVVPGDQTGDTEGGAFLDDAAGVGDDGL